MRRLKTFVAGTLGGLLFAAPLLAQTGGITGTVRNAETGAPVNGAHVAVEGFNINTFTQIDGRFSLSSVPVGDRTLRVRVIGYAALEQSVAVRQGEVTNVDLTLTPQAIALMEMVVTGVAGATPRAKLPFVVNQLRAEDLPVPSMNAASAIQGKIAGATVVQGSGRPGAAPSILLRGATALNASGRDQEPLYIVDGVILGQSMVDIDGLDIDQIEVVKGAAAASMYGSRAANGVVQITTRRGSEFADGQVRYTARTTFGTSDLPGEFPLLQHHFWETNADGSKFIDGDGTQCDFVNCSANIRLAGQTAAGGTRNEWNTFATNPWPGGTFDQVGRFFDGGDFQEHYISASGRQGATNFHLSFSRSDDGGVMLGQDGFRRNNFRVNLDQVVRPNVSVSASAMYSRSIQQGFGEGSGNPIFGLTRMMAGVNLAACEDAPMDRTRSCLDDPDNLILNANPTNTESPNPLYDLLVRTNDFRRGRFVASSLIRYSPTNWLDVEGDVSYDRSDREQVTMLPKGFRTIAPSPTTNEGNLGMSDWRNEALNTSLTATFRHRFGDRVSNRTQLRYLYEQQDIEFNTTDGYRFAVGDVPSFGNISEETLSAGSSSETVRADGYFIITSFDIDDRYILDALVRNDGSSLFGSDERRQWYWRAAAAWRMGAEPWFDVGGIDELKFRYSYGTAGGRPRFSAQYETFNVAAGSIIPVSLGNSALKPEHSAEQEIGVDLAFANRFDVELTYAHNTVSDLMEQVPLPAYTGFSSQWRNVGELESKTWEASLGARLVQTPDFSWTARVLFDRTTSTITELDVPDFRTGVPGQNMGNVFFIRAGEEIGTFYGPMAARSCADLPTGMSCDGFTVNDDGFLVWVGAGGLGANAWGTSSDVTVRGAAVRWGTPFAGECTDRVSEERTTVCPVGNTMPDYTVSLSSTLTWRGFSLYGLLDAVQGFDVYNQPLQWAVFRRNVHLYDQSGVPEADRKPIGYYDALYGNLGGLTPNSVFVEDASFIKLRELSLRYRLTADRLERIPGLSALNSVAFSASGRNLWTQSDYRGYDPEVGRAGGSVGSAALARVDGYNYPNFRTWLFGVELTF